MNGEELAMSDLQPDPLLMIPGLLCSPALFAAQSAAFGVSRPVVIADPACGDRVGAIAGRILADAPDRFALAGLSMGGYIAFEILRQAPSRVTRAAFLDTSALPDPPEREADRRSLIELARRAGVREVQRQLLPRLLHPTRLSDRPLCDRVLEMADAVGFEAFVRQQEAIIARPDSRPSLAAITCPTLVVVGAQGRIDAGRRRRADRRRHCGLPARRHPRLRAFIDARMPRPREPGAGNLAVRLAVLSLRRP